MTIADINNLIHHKNKFLLIPLQEQNLDVLSATYALGLSIKALSKSVSIYIDPSLSTDVIKDRFLTKSLKVINLNDLKSIVVTLSNLKSNVEDVQWKVSNDKLDIVINTDAKGGDNENLSVKLKTNDYDTCIVVGIDDPASLGELYDHYGNLFKPEKTIIISKNETEKLFAYKHFKIFTPTASQTMYYFLKEFQLNLKPEVATYLLGGIYWGTNTFTQSLNEHTYKIADKLVKAGANINEAISLGTQIVSLMQHKLYSYIHSGVKTTSNGYLYSIIKGDTIELDAKNFEVISSSLVPLIHSKGVEIAFVAIEGAEDNEFFIKSLSQTVDISLLQTTYPGVGNNTYYRFKTTDKVAAVVENLNKVLPALFYIEQVEESQEPNEGEGDPDSTNASDDLVNDLNPQSSESTETGEIQTQEQTQEQPQAQASTKEIAEIIQNGGKEPAPGIIESSANKLINETLVKPLSAVQNALSSDPLAPASEMPEPLKLDGTMTSAQKVDNSPLPEAN